MTQSASLADHAESDADGRGHRPGGGAALFAERGFDATSVREIAEAAGVTKPTLYYHFGSKQGLGEAILTRPMASMTVRLAGLVAATPGDRDPVGLLEAIFQIHLDFVADDPDRSRFVYAVCFGPADSGFRAEVHRYGEAFERSLLDAVARLADAGIIARTRVEACVRVCRGLIMAATLDHIYCGPGGRGRPRRAAGKRPAGRVRPGRRVHQSPGEPEMSGYRGRVRWVALLAVLGPLGSGCGHKVEKTAGADQAPKPVAVTVAAVTVRPIERAVDAVGTLRGWEQVTVGAKKVGRVVRVFHDIGDRVRPGELLVQCEQEDAELAVNQAEKQLLADLAKIGMNVMTIPKQMPDLGGVDVNSLPNVVEASVALDRAQNNLARERNLMTKAAGTKQDFQNAENDVRSAEARLANAILMARSSIAGALGTKVLLEIRRQALKDMEIRVPTPSQVPAGMKAPDQLIYAISKRDVSEGQMIREGDAVYDLAVENPLRLWLNVPERYSSQIQSGQEVRITVGSYPGAVFPGRVTRINPTVATDSRSFQVEAIVPNDEQKLRPGGFAKAEIVTDRDAQSTIVPLDAIVRFAGVTKLFLVEGGSKVRAVAVETGREGPGWVELLTALPADARVVTTGQSRLADGTAIAIRTPEAEPAAPSTAKPPTPAPPVPAPSPTTAEADIIDYISPPNTTAGPIQLETPALHQRTLIVDGSMPINGKVFRFGIKGSCAIDAGSSDNEARFATKQPPGSLFIIKRHYRFCLETTPEPNPNVPRWSTRWVGYSSASEAVSTLPAAIDEAGSASPRLVAAAR